MFYLLIFCITIMSKLIVISPNFSPIYSLFFLAYKDKKMIFPLVLGLLVSDMILGMYSNVFITYLSFFAIALTSYYMSTKPIASTLISSIVFFLISNFGCFLFYYPLTVDGLISCYSLAAPFYRNTLASLVFYNTAYYIISNREIIKESLPYRMFNRKESLINN